MQGAGCYYIPCKNTCVCEVNKLERRFYLVDAEVLPEVFLKVVKAKELLASGEVRSISAATRSVDLSRSAFYKYKDCITPFRDMKRDAIMTFHIKLHDKPGKLASVLSIFTESGANILTINQSIPANGVALVTISIAPENLIISSDELMARLSTVPGVVNIELMAG